MISEWDNFLTKPTCRSLQLEHPINSFDCHKNQIVSCSEDMIQLWEDFENIHSLRCASKVNSVIWSRDGTELVSAHGEPRFELKLWQVDKLS